MGFGNFLKTQQGIAAVLAMGVAAGEELGLQAKATQSHINATSKPPQSLLIANRLRPQSHSKATSMRP